MGGIYDGDSGKALRQVCSGVIGGSIEAELRWRIMWIWVCGAVTVAQMLMVTWRQWRSG